MHPYDDDEEADDGFGPGSDLVLSFLGIVLLLIGITLVTGLPKATSPAAMAMPVTAMAQAEDVKTQRLERIASDWKQRALRAERELAAAQQTMAAEAARDRARQAALAASTPSRGVPHGVVATSACQMLLHRSSLGERLTMQEEIEMRSKACMDDRRAGQQGR